MDVVRLPVSAVPGSSCSSGASVDERTSERLKVGSSFQRLSENCASERDGNSRQSRSKMCDSQHMCVPVSVCASVCVYVCVCKIEHIALGLSID